MAAVLGRISGFNLSAWNRRHLNQPGHGGVMATRNTKRHKKRKHNSLWLFVFFVANREQRFAAGFLFG